MAVDKMKRKLTTIFCADPAASAAQRARFVDRYTDSGATIFAAHFGGPTAGKIVRRNGATHFAVHDPDHRHG